jgi:hypothetical protein
MARRRKKGPAEADWLASTDPEEMLEMVKDRVSVRKMRLVGVTCCRHISHLFHAKAARSKTKSGHTRKKVLLARLLRRGYSRPDAGSKGNIQADRPPGGASGGGLQLRAGPRPF